MKVLIISDDKSLIENCSSVLESKNIDVIVYKWFIKALDNLEEIKPNVIIISTAEYPRHWKVLAPFISSGICGNDVKYYLYEPTPLMMQEAIKSDYLNVTGAFASPEEFALFFKDAGTVQNEQLFAEDDVPSVADIENTAETSETAIPGSNEIAAFLNNNSLDNKNVEESEETIVEEKVEENITETVSEDIINEEKEDVVEEKTQDGQIIFTNPKNNSFVTGKIVGKKDSILNCLMDFDINLVNGTNINKITYICNDEIKSAEATVDSIDNNLVTLTVNKYYEEV